jgi:hypothetical protein
MPISFTKDGVSRQFPEAINKHPTIKRVVFHAARVVSSNKCITTENEVDYSLVRRDRITPPYPCDSYETTKREPDIK